MNSTAPAPPRASTSPVLPRPAQRVEDLSPRAFRTLLLAIAAVAAAMAAEGVQTFAEMRERHYAILARMQAVSPVSYGTALPALHALTPAAEAGVRVLVRSDSAATEGPALCALAAQAAGGADVRWIAFSADVDPCVVRRVGGRMLRAGAPAAAEMGRARWLVMDADGHARYSRPGVPSLADVRRTAALLAPTPPAGGGEMRRRGAVIGAGTLLLLGVGALSAFHAGARAERELASALFTHPVALVPDVDRLLPARASADVRAIGTAERVLRIGGDAEDAEAAFGSVTDVAPSLSGDTVYVLDGMSASVSAFGADGRLLFAFGGKGNGPGEFRRPVQLLVLPWSGEVAVWDVDTQRLTVHTAMGQTVRVLAPGAADARGKARRIRAFGGGYVMEVHSDPLQVSRASQRGALVRLDTAARSPRTLFHFAIPAVHASHVEPAPGTSITTWLNPPGWSPEARWEVLADGTVLFAPGGPNEAFRIAPTGAVTRLHRESGYSRVTRRDRFRHLEGERDRHLIASPSTPVTVLEPLNRRFYAAVRPSVTGLLAGPGGSLWTRGFDTRDSWRGFSRTWHRTQADGAPAGDVRLPASFEPLHIIGGLVYGIAEDEMYVHRVEAYPVEEGR